MYRRSLLLLLALISVTCGNNALAQGLAKKNQAPPIVTTPPPKGPLGISAAVLPKFEAVQFSDLPDFTGQNKLLVQLPSKVESGTSWIQVRRAKETQQQVHDWYLNVLKMNKWVVIHDAPNVLIANNKDGNMFNLLINSGMDPVYPTEFELTYFLQKKRGSQTD
jgi:hypothetical protein